MRFSFAEVSAVCLVFLRGRQHDIRIVSLPHIALRLEVIALRSEAIAVGGHRS